MLDQASGWDMPASPLQLAFHFTSTLSPQPPAYHIPSTTALAPAGASALLGNRWELEEALPGVRGWRGGGSPFRIGGVQ